MGDRRMISAKIANDGGFLKMPVSSQCLYFHLVVRADDDGIVEALPVIRACGFNEDDLKILHAKEFVTVLNDNLVTFINHWREMNILRPDRKVDSRHLALLREKLPNEEILERRPRSDTRKGKREALAEKKKLDGPRTAQENLIQLNPNQQNLIEDKKRKDPSLLLPTDSRSCLDGKMGEGMDGKMDMIRIRGHV